ncbi:flagellar hook-basal body protein [Microaerobacter geothermalis]|uniref:flagellar hook-basal body protein n=1 Tax=Microaerobacter geothermalis TaxID=674972 RepID=UPI001F44404B|nr:flagellar hook-basal body protein [Microaerobacter geothermalis]MCF6093251.1 flagellar hook-basal body protein [Microaerobacter geothermalis]
MNTSLIIATSGMDALQKKIDTISNNIANVNTMGFKRREASFSELLARQMNNQPDEQQEVGRKTPLGIRVGQGMGLAETRIDLSQGQRIDTNNPFDLYIEGNAFFQVERVRLDDQGNEVREFRLTRDGSFKLVPNDNGNHFLVTSRGDFVTDNFGYPIEIPFQSEVNIDKQGTVTIKRPDSDQWEQVGQIGLYRLQTITPQQLIEAGDNQYTIPVDQIDPNGAWGDFVQAVDFANLQPNESYGLVQGALESSNVDLTKEMTELISAQRAFQLNSRAVITADQMMTMVNNLRG